MQWNYALYMLPMALASALFALVGVLAWRRRPVPGATSFVLLVFIAAGWTLANTFALSSASSGSFWHDLKYIFSSAFPVVYARFLFRHTKHTGKSLKMAAALVAVPSVTLLLLGWLYLAAGAALHAEAAASSKAWFWIDRTYGLALLVATVVVLAREVSQSPRLYRQQAFVLLVGSLLPAAALLLSPVSLLPEPSSQSLPFVFLFTGLGVTWSLLQYRLLDIVPAARDLVVESMSDLVLVLDAQNCIVDMNPAAQQATGYSVREAIGKRIETVFREAVLLHSGEPEEVEAQAEIVLKDGDEPRYFDLRISPLYGWRHLLAGWLIVLRDVTERKLYESELIAAKEQAEAIAQLKTALLNNVSHELRTPLTSIIGFAQIMTDEVAEEHREFAYLIEENGRRLLHTLNSILDLAQLNAGHQRARPEPFDAAAEVREIMRGLEPLALQKGLCLVTRMTEDELFCETDRTFLGRILTNLIGNAIKFTEVGEVAVTLEADEARLTLTVQDTGIGISEGFMPHLFEEFRQESASTNRSYEGNGLGLALTKHLVELMGGSITVKSRRCHGTTFIVTLARFCGDALQHPTLEEAELIG